MDLKRVTQRLADISARMSAELRKLCERPEFFDVAQAITDALDGTLDSYLCNYASIRDNTGRVWSVEYLQDALREQLHSAFQRLTGRAYVPEACRRLPQAPQDRHQG